MQLYARWIQDSELEIHKHLLVIKPSCLGALRGNIDYNKFGSLIRRYCLSITQHYRYGKMVSSVMKICTFFREARLNLRTYWLLNHSASNPYFSSDHNSGTIRIQRIHLTVLSRKLSSYVMYVVWFLAVSKISPVNVTSRHRAGFLPSRVVLIKTLFSISPLYYLSAR